MGDAAQDAREGLEGALFVRLVQGTYAEGGRIMDD